MLLLVVVHSWDGRQRVRRLAMDARLQLFDLNTADIDHHENWSKLRNKRNNSLEISPFRWLLSSYSGFSASRRISCTTRSSFRPTSESFLPLSIDIGYRISEYPIALLTFCTLNAWRRLCSSFTLNCESLFWNWHGSINESVSAEESRHFSTIPVVN